MITRRVFLKASGAATAGAVTAVGNTGIASVTDKPRTFVLVHGGWHGGWCWRRVADVLRARGHRVFAPSLTGVGDRAHLTRAALSTGGRAESKFLSLDPPAQKRSLEAGASGALASRNDSLNQADRRAAQPGKTQGCQEQPPQMDERPAR